MNMKTTGIKIVGAVMLLLAATVATDSAIAQTVGCDATCIQAKVDHHLLLMGEFGNDEALAASLRDLIATGTPVVPVVGDTYNTWLRSEAPDPQGSAQPSEMRWRAVHLLGSLTMRDAIPLLYDIAKIPLPDPRLDEDAFGDEVRIHLRAIAGLERLGAVDELKDLYSLGGVLRNSTAASLFVLGVNVGNVSRLDARTALAKETVDSTDYHTGTGRPPQLDKPGSRTFRVIPRFDTPATVLPKN
jgi:hypothetical protein